MRHWLESWSDSFLWFALMSNFRTIDRATGFLLPPSVDEWLPERHLARFVVEVVDGFDLRAMSGSYRGSGSASYHPRLLLGLLVYGYATGVFSSRKLERATYAVSSAEMFKGTIPVRPSLAIPAVARGISGTANSSSLALRLGTSHQIGRLLLIVGSEAIMIVWSIVIAMSALLGESALSVVPIPRPSVRARR